MTLSLRFENFCSNIRISDSSNNIISARYKRITTQLNKDFWTTDSSTSHSLYVGSYGRDTEIKTSDIDMLFQLPYSMYEKFNKYEGNGQSALLQEVRESIKKTYPITSVGADGQIVSIPFTDNINFEVLPAFINEDSSFTYPDSNNGGKWKVTNPKAEINEIKLSNKLYNYNLKRLSRMVRAWRDKWNLNMGGLLIDTLAHRFLTKWKHRQESYLYYDFMTRDFFEFLKNQETNQLCWYAPGSYALVEQKDDFRYKALRAYNISLEAIEYENQKLEYSATEKWREIYGSKFSY